MPRQKRNKVEIEDLKAFLPTKRSKRSKKNDLNVNNDNNSVETDLKINDDIEKREDIIKDVSTISGSLSDKLLSIELKLCAKIKDVTFQSVRSIQYIYNPLEYALETHTMYVRKYCNNPKKILFLGMNPGPWGMSQTGVPFGEINMVRDWLKISGSVGNPEKEHPDRKVTGFRCTRSEVSGQRLWGLFKQLCSNPENFFSHAYMHNYCPLAFMDSGARNITPAELKGEGQTILHEACDKALTDAAKLLNVKIIVGIGRYAEKRAQIAVQTAGLQSVQVMFLPHPSPRAVGNGNWSEKAIQKLDELKLLPLFQSKST